MPYTITSGTEAEVQSRESATATLELVRELETKKIPNIKVSDRDGISLTVVQLEKLSEKENI